VLSRMRRLGLKQHTHGNPGGPTIARLSAFLCSTASGKQAGKARASHHSALSCCLLLFFMPNIGTIHHQIHTYPGAADTRKTHGPTPPMLPPVSDFQSIPSPSIHSPRTPRPHARLARPLSPPPTSGAMLPIYTHTRQGPPPITDEAAGYSRAPHPVNPPPPLPAPHPPPPPPPPPPPTAPAAIAAAPAPAAPRGGTNARGAGARRRRGLSARRSGRPRAVCVWLGGWVVGMVNEMVGGGSCSCMLIDWSDGWWGEINQSAKPNQTNGNQTRGQLPRNESAPRNHNRSQSQQPQDSADSRTYRQGVVLRVIVEGGDGHAVRWLR
jgi:hypothetical protein